MRIEVNRERLEALGAEERAEVEGLLAELDALRQDDPLQFFDPLPPQRAFLSAGRVRVKLAAAGNRSGKSVAGCVDDYVQAVDAGSLPDHLKEFKIFDPPFFGRVVCPDLTNALEGVVLPLFRKWAPRRQLLGGSWEKAFDKQRRMLSFANGSWIQFLTSEMDVDKHAGAALHRVRFDEEPKGPNAYEIYRESRMRIIDYDGQICFTMTPLLGLSFVYDEVWERRDEPDVFCVRWGILDNPHLPREVVESELAGMRTDEERQARGEGRFVHYRGRVLEEYDQDVHMVPEIRPKDLDGRDILVGIDPGISRGGVLWAADDRDKQILCFDELYPSGLTVPQIAEQIKEKNALWKVDPLYVIDPSARNRDLINAENVEGAFARERIFCSHGQNDRRAGVLELKARLVDRALLITENCVNLRREIDRWLVAQDETTGETRSVKGSASGFRTIGPDHLCDPLRYIAMERLYVPEHVETKDPRDPMGYASKPKFRDSESYPLGAYA